MVCHASTHPLPRVQDIGIGPSLLVAFLAGCGNVLLTNPIWTVATRMQAQTPLQLPVNAPELLAQAKVVIRHTPAVVRRTPVSVSVIVVRASVGIWPVLRPGHAQRAACSAGRPRACHRAKRVWRGLKRWLLRRRRTGSRATRMARGCRRAC